MISAHDHSLHQLFWPKSIAVIGASPDVTKIRGRLLSFLTANGYEGNIVPVNPSHREIFGLPCASSIEDAGVMLGVPIDVALVAIPAKAVLAELTRCAKAGVKHAVVIAAGFAEEGGANTDIQAQLTELAQRTGMRICGPNAEGYYNSLLNLAATFTPTLAERPEDSPRISNRRVGIIAQSGGVGYALFQQGRRAGLDFSYVMTSGNEADVGLAELIEYMVADDHTQVIFVYVETIRDPNRFMEAALTAQDVGKHIVAIKIGQSSSGQRAAASHTAAMAGWSVAYDCLFKRCGIHQALDLEEALAMCCLLVSGPTPHGKRIAVITASGGAGAWAGDTIERLGGCVPILSDPVQNVIREYIPSYGAPANPIDVTAQALRSGGMLKIAEYLTESAEVDAILIVTSLTIKHFFFDKEHLKLLADNGKKPLLFYSFSIPTELAIVALSECGIAFSTNLPGACSALLKLADPKPSGYQHRYRIPDLPQAVKNTLLQSDDVLCEFEVKEILRHYAVSGSREYLVQNETEAVEAAIALGYPVAMKIQSPQLPHKTDIGGVRLNLTDDNDCRVAYRELVDIAFEHCDERYLRGILVQAMAPTSGYEFIIGTMIDEAMGPLILVGYGGVAVELFKDVIYRFAPVDVHGALAMIGQLKSSALLTGFRGGPKIDLAPLAELIAKVSGIAWELSEVVDEIELNPVIVHTAPDYPGLTIADALVRRHINRATLQHKER